MKTLSLLAVLLNLGLATLRAAPKQPARQPSVAKASTPAASRLAAPAGPAVVASSGAPAARASANYTLAVETFDAGGSALLSSASYQINDASAGTVGGLAGAGVYLGKAGYAGQVYDVLGLEITGPAASVNEGGSVQLGAAPLLDDNSLLPSLPTSEVSWSAVSGPITSVSATGLVTAGTVYQNTLATVRAAVGSLTGIGLLTVLNVTNDDYGSYAGDGIDDAWQVQYFGFNNPKAGPNVDADGTGQTNLFKYLAGLNPLDPTSRFVLTIVAVPGQPGQKTLIFSPVYSGRTYTVQSTTSLTQPNWTTLSGASVSVSGTMETVTDPNATSAPRFYRVLVSLP